MYHAVDPETDICMYWTWLTLKLVPVGLANPVRPVRDPVPASPLINVLVDVVVRNTVSESPSLIVLRGDDTAPDSVGYTARVPEMVVGKRELFSVPELMFVAFRLVRFAPLTAGSVAGNLASGSVPLDRSAALIAPLNDPAETAPVIDAAPADTVPPNELLPET
jgi:hypothetical protein